MPNMDVCCNNPVYINAGYIGDTNQRIWICNSCEKFFINRDDGSFGIYELQTKDRICLSLITEQRDALKKELEEIKSKKRNPLEIGSWDDLVFDDRTTFHDLYFPVFNEDKYKDVLPILLKEIEHACVKFPNPDNLVPALLEEVGEFGEENVETKRTGGNHELIQIACLALRLYVEGDPAYDPEHIEKVSELVERAIKLGRDARAYLVGLGVPD